MGTALLTQIDFEPGILKETSRPTAAAGISPALTVYMCFACLIYDYRDTKQGDYPHLVDKEAGVERGEVTQLMSRSSIRA